MWRIISTPSTVTGCYVWSLLRERQIWTGKLGVEELETGDLKHVTRD
jgi:hypothetical protein